MKHVAAELLKVAQLLLAGDVEIKGPDFRREFADAGNRGEYATFMYVKKGETTPKLRRIKPTHITSTFVKGKEEGSPIDKMFLYEGIVSDKQAPIHHEVKPEPDKKFLSVQDKIKALNELGLEQDVNEKLHREGFEENLKNFMDEKKWHVLYKLVATGEGGKLYLGKAASNFKEGYSDSATWTSHTIFLYIDSCKPEDAFKHQHHRFSLDISKGRKQWDE
jgi:hypothetical protein